MRIATYYEGNTLRLGAVIEDVVAPFSESPESMMALISSGRDPESLVLDRSNEQPLREVRFGPSVPTPLNIVCVGKNYPLHAEEEGADVPETPLLFGKHTSTVTGPADNIVWDPEYTSQVDWEVELTVVIGKAARNVSIDDALSHVFGYTVANDVSARDIQFGDGQWLRGKSLETFMPIGPVIVTPSELGDPQALDVECRVNGIVKQSGNTSQMYHPIANIISFCSQAFTLQPGDIILTGTPAGVGVFRDPPEFLRHGDVMETEIQGIGVLRNECVAVRQ